MLVLENLVLRQGGFRLSADWQVAPGARVALIGPSGAGKSTLMNAIAGFVTPDSGRIFWNNRELTGMPPGQRPVAMLFQDGNLFPHLDIGRNVALGLSQARKLSGTDRARVSEALTRVGLSGMEDRTPSSLSGGQQSRAALARVLVMDRPLLLLDEPFSALGPALRQEMLGLVSDLCRQTQATLLMVSHAPEDARRIAEQIIFVDEGRAEAPVATAQALRAPSEAMQRYLG
ncbi:thiamine ABC transporter ATP-binding protein [Pseudooceanicola sp. C21-150M6]|uniref:thiamine ABC transporter ATP-binding protein n=1 Tax=Pseudooceanicola sp. C21-150M6 TaxID=3434355 RepID=UPI003D7F64A5